MIFEIEKINILEKVVIFDVLIFSSDIFTGQTHDIFIN